MIEKIQISYKNTTPQSYPDSWGAYFKNAVVGQTYNILRDGDEIIMSDLPYEYFTNQPLIDKVAELAQNESQVSVLMIGHGMGMVNDYICHPNVSITIIEKDASVISMFPPKNGETVVNGDVNNVNLTTKFVLKCFDLIWVDITEDYLRDADLKQYLKNDGEIMYWRHRHFPQDLNYSLPTKVSASGSKSSKGGK